MQIAEQALLNMQKQKANPKGLAFFSARRIRSPALNFCTRVPTGAALSNPYSKQEVQHRLVLDFLWWGRTDSICIFSRRSERK
jgi:hypothetical protein